MVRLLKKRWILFVRESNARLQAEIEIEDDTCGTVERVGDAVAKEHLEQQVKDTTWLF